MRLVHTSFHRTLNHRIREVFQDSSTDPLDHQDPFRHGTFVALTHRPVIASLVMVEDTTLVRKLQVMPDAVIEMTFDDPSDHRDGREEVVHRTLDRQTGDHLDFLV